MCGAGDRLSWSGRAGSWKAGSQHSWGDWSKCTHCCGGGEKVGMGQERPGESPGDLPVPAMPSPPPHLSWPLQPGPLHICCFGPFLALFLGAKLSGAQRLLLSVVPGVLRLGGIECQGLNPGSLHMKLVFSSGPRPFFNVTFHTASPRSCSTTLTGSLI